MTSLTRSEKKTLDYIALYIAQNGIAPTTAEIATGIHIQSRGVVHRYLKGLSEKGYLTLLPNKRRNIVLTPPEAENMALPLVGKIAAGLPIEAMPHVDALDLSVFLGQDRYALKVEGDSMIDEGIWDGDVVVCEKANSARSGTIVVALVDQDAATLKRFYKNEDNTVTLVPANATHQPQIYQAERVAIQGVFVGLLRFTGGLR